MAKKANEPMSNWTIERAPPPRNYRASRGYTEACDELIRRGTGFVLTFPIGSARIQSVRTGFFTAAQRKGVKIATSLDGTHLKVWLAGKP